MITCTEFDSPLGPLLVAASGQGLCGLYFREHRHFRGADGWRRDARQPLLLEARAQLDDYFAGRRQAFDLPLAAQGTTFQKAVWRELAKIAHGDLLSYGELAQRLGQPRAVRAVGAAIGRNPLCIIVPCHRVVGANRALTGYAGGLARKQALLALEGVMPAPGAPAAPGR